MEVGVQVASWLIKLLIGTLFLVIEGAMVFAFYSWFVQGAFPKLPDINLGLSMGLILFAQALNLNLSGLLSDSVAVTEISEKLAKAGVNINTTVLVYGLRFVYVVGLFLTGLGLHIFV